MIEDDKDKSAPVGGSKEPVGAGGAPPPGGPVPGGAAREGGDAPPAGAAARGPSAEVKPPAAGEAGAGAEAKPAPKARVAAPDATELTLRAAVPSVPLERLRSAFPELAAGATFFAGVAIVRLPVDRLVEVCRFLKKDREAEMNYLSNLHGTHYPDRAKAFEVVYNLYSISKHHWIEIKVEIGEGEEVPTMTGVWKTAGWHEREAFDLLGIRFSGHPDLTRILLPETWRGHPLRKEYPLEGREGDHVSYR